MPKYTRKEKAALNKGAASSSINLGCNAALLLGDLHAGSDGSPLPSGFQTSDGKTIGPNPIQKELNRIFQETIDEALEAIRGSRFCLILMGDMTEGIHHGGKQVISQNENEHVSAALGLVTPVALKALESGGKVIVMQGTECHDKESASIVGEKLGAVKDPMSNKFCFDRLQIRIWDCLVDLAHHMPCTSRSYLEAGRMSILMGNLTNNLARDGFVVPKVIVRAHSHTQGFFSNGRQQMLSMPHYQAKTRHSHKVVGESGQAFGCATMSWLSRGQGMLPRTEIHSRALNSTIQIEV